MVEEVSAPTLFDIAPVDHNYLPDDATSVISFLNPVGTYEALLEHQVMKDIGTIAWESIRKEGVIRNSDSYRETFMAWRNSCATKLESTLEGLFPNRWELQYTPNGNVVDEYHMDVLDDLIKAKGDSNKLNDPLFGDELVKCYIHFPEIPITNSRREQWTILDYYVVIAFNNRMGVNSIMGFRATKTPIEYNKHYTFSHSKTADNALCKFCFGHTSLDTLVAGLYVGPYDEIGVELFLQNLNDYLSWESKDGVPFCSISDLIPSRYGRGNPPQLLDSIVHTVKDFIIEAREDVDVEISLSGGRFSVYIPVNMKLVEMVTKYTPEEWLFPLSEISLASIYSSGELMSDASIEYLNKEYKPLPAFKFKGNNVVMKVIQDRKEQKDECRKYSDIRLVDAISKRMASQINDFMYEYSWTGIREKGVS